MIVVDASAAVEALVRSPANEGLVLRLGATTLHAPHLLDVEVLHALRRLVARGELAEARAEQALADFAALGVTRYPHVALRARVWELRFVLSAYDGAYVALAEALGAPVVTTDERLARSSGHRAAVEAFPRG